MIRLLPLALAVLLGTAHAEEAAAPARSGFVTLTGTATYRQRVALPSDAVLHLRARDQARGLTLNEQEIPLDGHQVPVAFNLTVDRDLIGPKTRLVLDGRITRGQRTLFAGSTAAGHETTQLLLKPVAKAKTPR